MPGARGGVPRGAVSYGYSEGYSDGRDVRTLDCDGVVATLEEAADLLLT